MGYAFLLFRFSNDSGVEQLFFLYVTASGLWSPIILGAVIGEFSIAIALFIPETLHLRNAKLLESSEMEEQRSMDMASQHSSEQKGHGFKAQMQRPRDTMQFLKRDIPCIDNNVRRVVARAYQSTSYIFRRSIVLPHQEEVRVLDRAHGP